MTDEDSRPMMGDDSAAADMHHLDEPQLTPAEEQRARSSLIVLAIGGLLTGFDIGVVTVILAFYKSIMSVPCTTAVSESACDWLAGTSGSSCTWLAHRAACVTPMTGQLCLANGDINRTYCGNLTQVPLPSDPYKTENVTCRWQLRENGETTRAFSYGMCLDALPAQKAALWSSVEMGLIAAALIAGGFLSSAVARRFVATPRRVVSALRWIGVISIVSCVFHCFAWFMSPFGARLALLIVGRFIAGIVLGAGSVFCTLFNALHSPPQVVPVVGVYFQVYLTVGILFAALLGFACNYQGSSHVASADESKNLLTAGVIQKFQLVFGANFALSLVMCFLPNFVSVRPNRALRRRDSAADGHPLDGAPPDDEDEDEDAYYYEDEDEEYDESAAAAAGRGNYNSFQNPQLQQEEADQNAAGPTNGNSNNNNNIDNNNNKSQQELAAPVLADAPLDENTTDPPPAAALAPAPATGCAVWTAFCSNDKKYVLAGTLLAIIQQLCGVNAIMAYSSQIASAQGMSNPLLSNVVVMSWNCITACLAVPLAKAAKARGYTPRHIYTAGAFVTALACLVTGVPSFPSVGASTAAREGFAIFGIALFLLAFELCMGPHFWTLAQLMFPERIRRTACVYTLTVHYIFTAAVMGFFPLLLDWFGGTGGAPDGGQSDEQKHRGMGGAFVLFGCVDFISVAILQFLLPKLVEE